MLNEYGDEVGFELGDRVRVQHLHTNKHSSGTVQDYRQESNQVKVSGRWYDADNVYKD